MGVNRLCFLWLSHVPTHVLHSIRPREHSYESWADSITGLPQVFEAGSIKALENLGLYVTVADPCP